MRVGVLGTGIVGRTIAGKLAELGHDVSIGTRDPAALAERTEPDLNTVTAWVMVNPAGVGGGEHTMFLSGDDADAKAEVKTLLKDGFGWKHVMDL
jgi:predicted dinucleotide-binding enzyme